MKCLYSAFQLSGICAESRVRIIRKVVFQCISNVTMRRDISIIDRQMMNSFTGFLYFDCVGPILYRFNQCLLTVWDISPSLSRSNAISIQATPGWFTLELLKSPVALFDCIFTSVGNQCLLKRFGTAEVLGIDSSEMSFKMEVNKDMGSLASVMADWCRRVQHRC